MNSEVIYYEDVSEADCQQHANRYGCDPLVVGAGQTYQFWARLCATSLVTRTHSRPLLYILSRLEAKLDHLVLKVDGLAGMQQQQQQQVSQMLSILVAWQSAAVPLALVPNI